MSCLSGEAFGLKKGSPTARGAAAIVDKSIRATGRRLRVRQTPGSRQVIAICALSQTAGSQVTLRVNSSPLFTMARMLGPWLTKQPSPATRTRKALPRPEFASLNVADGPIWTPPVSDHSDFPSNASHSGRLVSTRLNQRAVMVLAMVAIAAASVAAKATATQKSVSKVNTADEASPRTVGVESPSVEGPDRGVGAPGAGGAAGGGLLSGGHPRPAVDALLRVLDQSDARVL